MRTVVLRTAIIAVASLSFCVLIPASTTAQSVTDPQVVEFTASADHFATTPTGDPVVSQYSLEIYAAGGSQPLQVASIGKPAPAADGRIRISLSDVLTATPSPNLTYMARVAAVGPTGVSPSDWSNTFTFTAVAPPAAGSLTNGSFESDYTGWQVSGNQLVVLNGTYGSSVSDGTKAVAFNGGQRVPDGVLSQTFATVPGQAYVLTFDLGAFSLVNNAAQSVQVTLTGAATLASQTMSVNAPGTGTQYASQQLPFVADQGATTVTFHDVSAATDDVDLFLDNVRVTAAAVSAPSITSQPQSATVGVGEAVSFSVAASGSGTLAYQWYLNGQALAGATGTQYSIPSAQTANAGSYTVAVGNSAGSTISAAATLSVRSAPTATAFVNGGFEQDYTGWTASGNQQVVTNGSFGASVSEGARAVAFNSGQKTPDGVLRQTFATIVGQKYSLAFDLGAFSLTNRATQKMQFSVEGATVLVSRTVSVTASGRGTKYASQSYTFVANTPTTVLTFQDVSQVTADVDLLLDNVTVRPRAK